MDHYYLMRKNVKVLKFSIVKISGIFSSLKEEEVYVKEQLPLYMKCGGNVENFLKNRFIPKNRENAKAIKDILKNIDGTYNLEKLIVYTKSVSLNDDFWTKRIDDDSTWEETNAYVNKFSESTATIAFTGKGSSGYVEGLSYPEYTTNGALAKAWRRIDGVVYLYKAGTSGFSNSGLEPYSEYYAAGILRRMGIEHVDYDLAKWKGRLCSTCKLFTSPAKSFITFDIYLKSKNKNTLELLASEDNRMTESIRDMIVFDALVNNTDRHLHNFGVLQDNTSMELSEVIAPIFDNGYSLFCHEMEKDFITRYDELLHDTSMFKGQYTFDQISSFISDNQKVKLRKLIGFRFERHPKYNLPEWRLKLLEELIQERLQIMLSIK